MWPGQGPWATISLEALVESLAKITHINLNIIVVIKTAIYTVSDGHYCYKSVLNRLLYH